MSSLPCMPLSLVREGRSAILKRIQAGCGYQVGWTLGIGVG